MKKHFSYKFQTLLLLIFVSVTLLFSSCKKYLDQQPITAVGADFVFSDISTTFKALAGVYSALTGDQGYGIRLSLYYTVDTDETQGPGGTIDDDRRGLARYAATPANLQINAPFIQMFRGIEYANICIDNIPKMSLYTSGSDQQKKQLQRMLGEALTLRAQFYFEAIRNWGDLPTHFLPGYLQAPTDAFPTRTNRDTLYNRLLADLKIASDLVPWRNDLTAIGDQLDERITKGSVKGLRARIALFRGGYSLRNITSTNSTATMQRSSDYLVYNQIAKDECNDIINSGQHILNTNFRTLFKDQVGARVVADPQGELMFQVSGIGTAGIADTKLGYYNGPTIGTFGNKSINIIPTYFYLFDSADLRRDVTCTPYNVAADGIIKIGQPITAICDGKYRRDWISNPAIPAASAAQYFGLKWQILRYSDVLLMYAEAENELNGPTVSAYNAINQVRRRGYGKPVTTANATVDLSGLNKGSFFDAIVKERSLELGGEGVRKYDLIRWNLLATKLNDTKTALAQMVAGTGIYAGLPTFMYFKNASSLDDNTLWVNSFYKPAPTATPAGSTRVAWVSTGVTTTTLARFATGFTINKSELLPIPQAQVIANFNLTQNPGY
ncbi:MAG: RagB/SusD family nutrient uptake outer membrane protein [Deinococcales bacterium]|nr:RagB/SusD family nutrient uptake outer membrane protein [Chitinophagaceae bacterium]